LEAIHMWWLDDIVVPAVLIIGFGCFVVMARWRTRDLTRETTRTAESMYPSYAGSIRQQRKYAEEHGGTWQDDEERQDALTRPLTPPSKTAGRPATQPPPTPGP
jgi:hypothetical protein